MSSWNGMKIKGLVRRKMKNVLSLGQLVWVTFYEQHVDSSTLAELAAESHISFKPPSRKGTSQRFLIGADKNVALLVGSWEKWVVKLGFH